MKKCTNCKKIKAYIEFNRSSKSKDGFHCYCKSCSKKQSSVWYARNPEKKREYYLNRPNRTEYNRAHNLKQNYGITIKEYEILVKKQNNLCAICHNPEVATNKITGKALPLSIDHCHNTGKIRKLLCVSCNIGLGNFKDSIQLLKRAVDYLEVSRCA
jgi:hypothetical protein